MPSASVFQTANRMEKRISEQGFEVQRMGKADIKRFLAVYFEASMDGGQMPDVDGEQFFGRAVLQLQNQKDGLL